MNIRQNPFGAGYEAALMPVAKGMRHESVELSRPLFSGAVPDEYHADSSPTAVPVNVWVKQFLVSKPLANAKVVDLTTGDSWKTGEDGYARFSVEPGRVLTLILDTEGFADVQTASVTVPPEGLTDVNNEITLQVAADSLYQWLRLGIGKPEPGKRHVVLTVSEAGKNLHDDDGEAGAVVTLRSTDGSVVHENPVYLGKTPASLKKIFGGTEWFRPILSSRIPLLKRFAHKTTTGDGGVIFRNVEPIFKEDGSPGEYIIEARKTGPDGKPMVFSAARVIIFPNSPEVINVSPPLGPRVQGK